MQPRALERARLHGHEGQTRKSSVKSLWSALQTHLQGVDRTTLAIVPEKCRHRAALLSRLNEVNNNAPCKGEQAKASAKSNPEAGEA
jgi:hypothetical protein